MPDEQGLTPEQLEEVNKQMEMESRKGELLNWCNAWLTDAKNWRLQNFEESWHRSQRNSDAIYDPKQAQKKEAWQSKAFIPLIPSKV